MLLSQCISGATPICNCALLSVDMLIVPKFWVIYIHTYNVSFDINVFIDIQNLYQRVVKLIYLVATTRIIATVVYNITVHKCCAFQS